VHNSGRTLNHVAAILFCGFFGALVESGIVLAQSNPNPVTVYLSPDDQIQPAVDAVPEGSTFVLREGTYRMQAIKPKNGDNFRGEGTAILNGSQVLTFTSSGKGLWAAGAAPYNYSPGKCDKSHPLCAYEQDLFFDNQVQEPVSDISDVRKGFWYFDRGAGKIYIGTDPGGHLLELGATPYAFKSSATNVHIQNLTVEKYRVQAQHGAIEGLGAGWVVDDVEARWNHSGGIVLGAGSKIVNSYAHHNGQKGLSLTGANCQLINTEISWNNYAGFSGGWEAGGTKFVRTDNLLVKSNYVHDNYGPGLWTDGDNIHTTYEDNLVINNRGDGIKHEISYDAVITGNTVKGNGASGTVWLWHSQILIQNSSNVNVHDNTVEVPPSGGNGISIINQNRGSGAYGTHTASNNSVHNNTITYLGSGASGLVDDTGNHSSNGNTFDYDHYVLENGDTKKHWSWFTWKTWSELHAVSQEVHGTCCN
jgi:parallel beta-helix repeat protein